jgi:hypothetical protein
VVAKVLWLLASVALPLGLATPAAGQGLGAHAAVELHRVGAVKECLELSRAKDLRPCGRLGTRRVGITWATGCGPQVADEDRETTVEIVAEPPGPTGMPYLELGPDDDGMPASGEATFLLFPGWKVHAEATVTCRGPQPTEPTEPPAPVDEGDPLPAPAASQVPSEAMTARSATMSAPPWLAGRSVAFASYCARSPGELKALKGKLQAGRIAFLRYWVRYATMAQHPLMGDPLRAEPDSADRKRIRLYASGAGIEVSRRPERAALRGFGASLELKLRPRRAGTLRIWARIDGVKTNALRIAVARGC